MKKFLKLIAILAAVCVVLLIAAFITLKIMFPAEKLKAMAQDYAQKTLHREVTFSDVSLNLVGVTLDDFAVSERGTFKDGTFAKADQAVVKIALKPLFKKRVEISTVGLEGLDLNVIKGKDGLFNFDDLIPASDAETAQAQTPAESSSSDFVLMAEKIYATDCNLYYKDLQSGMDASVTKLNLEINHFDLNKPFDVALSFTTDYQDAAGLAVTVPVKMDVQANLAGLDMAKAQATLKNLTLTYKNIKFTLWGGAKNFNNPVVDLQGKISGVSNTALADVLPDLPAFVLPDINLTASAVANLDASTARINQAKLSIRDSAVTARGDAAWGGRTPTYNMTADVNLNLKQIAETAAMLAGYAMDGSITGKLTATEKKNGKDVRGNIALSNLTVQYDPLVVSNLNGNIIINSLSDISCPALKGLLNGEVFTSSFAYKELGSVLDLIFNFDLSKLTLARFPGGDANAASAPKEESGTAMAATGPETFFNVKANINIGQITVPYFTTQGFSLAADLKRASAAMKNATGSVNFTLQEGAVTDLDLFARENRVLKILMLPLTLIKNVTGKLGVDIFPAQNPEDKGKIKFSSGSGTYVFTNGLMNIQETHFNSAVSDMKASGSINFPTDALDMRVSATVLTSQTPIIIKIGGTLTNPSGKLDVAGTAASLVTGILNYKTPVKVAGSAAQVTGDATKAVVNKGVDVGKNAADLGADAVKGTVGVAVGAIKGLGGLFKSRDNKDEAKDSGK